MDLFHHMKAVSFFAVKTLNHVKTGLKAQRNKLTSHLIYSSWSTFLYE